MRVRSNKHWCLLRSVHTHPIRFNPISLNYNKTLGSNCAEFGSSVDTVQTVWIRIRIGAAFEILLLQFRSAFCLSFKKKKICLLPPCMWISDSIVLPRQLRLCRCCLAFSSPAQACTGRFGSMCHVLVYANYAFFSIPVAVGCLLIANIVALLKFNLSPSPSP